MKDPVEWAKAVGLLLKQHVTRALQPIEARIEALETRPPPERGEKGTDGIDGKDGKSVTAEEVRTFLEADMAAWAISFDAKAQEVLLRALDGIKAPTDGRDGQDGKSVTLEDVRTYLDAEVATWALSFERRGQEVLQRALDRIQPPKDGIDGKDGAPGFSLDDLQIDDNGEGAVTLRFVRGDLVRERTIRLPVLIDRGVFRDGMAYLKGDGVTFGGSFWIAQQDLPQGKPGTSAEWRLAVKKGRDGADR